MERTLGITLDRRSVRIEDKAAEAKSLQTLGHERTVAFLIETIEHVELVINKSDDLEVAGNEIRNECPNAIEIWSVGLRAIEFQRDFGDIIIMGNGSLAHDLRGGTSVGILEEIALLIKLPKAVREVAKERNGDKHTDERTAQG